MTRWGPWSSKVLELLAESQRLYKDTGCINPYSPRLRPQVLLLRLQEGDTAHDGLVPDFHGQSVACAVFIR